ncbi:MAG: GGDEF domain-containing protein [Lachnospiraceae bacterium]|nr:GGDEF domain-containing protein [Lachnospiraceae bacterium]
MFEKLKKWIMKDLTGENEAARVAFIIRINSLLMCSYFLLWAIGFAFEERWRNVVSCGVCLYAFAVSMWLTYRNKVNAARYIYSTVLVLWMTGFVMQWGWDCGIQHFIFVLLALIFVSSYNSDSIKFLGCVGIFALRMFLYVWHIIHEPFEILDDQIIYIFQMFNIVYIFSSMIIVLYFFTRDIMDTEAKLARYNQKLRAVAGQDPLTKLPNREKIYAYIDEKIKSKTLENGMCVAMGDIDFFKKVNDTYGHDAGDEVLRSVAAVFREYMSEHGSVARWGGEEFLFIFVNENLDTAGSEVFELLGKIRALPIEWNGEILKITMTFGVADVNIAPGDGDNENIIADNVREAITSADQKLYMGKKGGRNTVMI